MKLITDIEHQSLLAAKDKLSRLNKMHDALVFTLKQRNKQIEELEEKGSVMDRSFEELDRTIEELEVSTTLLEDAVKQKKLEGSRIDFFKGALYGMMLMSLYVYLAIMFW